MSTEDPILVTGAEGFVGAHVVSELASHGHSVLAAYLSPPSAPVTRWWHPDRDRITPVFLDVTDRYAAQRLLDDCAPGGIIHAAAITDPSTGSLSKVNLGGTKNVLGPSGPAVKVFVSTASVYLDTETGSEPITEEDAVVSVPPCVEDWTYAQSKRAAELWAIERGGIHIARIAACFGPLERPTSNRTVMSLGYAAAQASRQSKRIEIEHGNLSDLTYVRDTARGIVSLLEVKSTSSIINIATGSPVDLSDLVRAVNSHATHANSETLRLSGYIRRSILDTRKLQSNGLSAQYSLRTAFQEYEDWLSHNDY